jgi:hypothetical protein
MSELIYLANLEVIGYMGQVESEQWPTRLLPVFRDRTSTEVLAPPFEERDDSVCGVRLTQTAFEP